MPTANQLGITEAKRAVEQIVEEYSGVDQEAKRYLNAAIVCLEAAEKAQDKAHRKGEK